MLPLSVFSTQSLPDCGTGEDKSLSYVSTCDGLRRLERPADAVLK